MLKIKVYDCETEIDLEKRLNQLSEQCDEHNQEIIDIKFSTRHFCDGNQEQVFCFSALVMYDDKLIKEYKPKRYEIVEKVEDR